MNVSRPVGRTIAGFAVLAIAFGCQPKDPTVKQTPVKIVSESDGVGRPAMQGDLVTIRYHVRLEDGRVILAESGYRFVLGAGSVIGGIDDGVVGMRVTGEREILVPPHLHWGRKGYGDGAIPADAILSVAVRLDAID